MYLIKDHLHERKIKLQRVNAIRSVIDMLDVLRYYVLMKSNQDHTAKQEKLMVHLMQLCLNNSDWICLHRRKIAKKKNLTLELQTERNSVCYLLWLEFTF